MNRKSFFTQEEYEHIHKQLQTNKWYDLIALVKTIIHQVHSAPLPILTSNIIYKSVHNDLVDYMLKDKNIKTVKHEGKIYVIKKEL